MFEKHKNKIIQIRTTIPSFAAGWCCCTEHPLVLSTINQGYCLQFAVKTPLFNSVLKSAQLLEEEIASLLSKRAIRIVLLEDSHHSFYSRFFVIPKRVEGCPILDLWNLKKTPQEVQIQNAHNQYH